MNDTRTIPLGQFEVTGDKVMVTDPCYDRDTWCQGTLPALPGRWAAEMEVGDRPGWGRRVHAIRAFHVDVAPRDVRKRAKFEVGVDSGQAGIFDEARYPQDETGDYDDLESFYGRACSATHDRDGEDDSITGGVIAEGAVSSSGYGDGGYVCYYRTDEEGRAVEVEIVFIGDESDEEDEDNLDEEAA
jgi:hypothetical protein